MAEKIFWSPVYKLYNLKDELILLTGERNSFCFPIHIYPFLKKIKDGISINTLIADEPDFEKATRNLYFIEDLIKKGVLSNREEESALQYRSSKPDYNEKVDIVEIESFSFVNLSTSSNPSVKKWIELFQDAVKELAIAIPIKVILVDSFLDKRLKESISSTKNWCMIKINGADIWISSLSTEKNPIDICQLQYQLLRNQPARHFVERILPDQNHAYPLKESIDTLNHSRSELSRIILSQLQAKEQRIAIFNSTSLDTAHHYILPCFDHNMADQIHSPITLELSRPKYEKDGGSRTIPPERTVDLVMKLVSPVTGVISQLIEPDNTDSAPIKIYRAAYYKTPSTRRYSRLDNSSFLQICMGKGISPAQSKASALCEAIERVAAQYRGDEPYVLSKQSGLSKRNYCFHQLAPYSPGQYANFADNTHPDSELAQAVEIYKNTTTAWIPLYSLTRSDHVYLPFSTCFANTPFDDERFGLWQSNGCAAGNTLEEAILQGLYELIERDAAAIWWYNQVVRPKVDLDILTKENLEKIQATLGQDIDFWVLDIMTEINVPAMVAVGRHRTSGKYTLGFGCHLQREMAAQRALTELCQIMSVRGQNSVLFNFDAIETGPYLHPGYQQEAAESFANTSNDLKVDIESIIRRLDSTGFETLVLNYSRAYVPIKTVKVVVPGMCHMWPQLGNERLYKTPVMLGWLNECKNERTINQQGLYI